MSPPGRPPGRPRRMSQPQPGVPSFPRHLQIDRSQSHGSSVRHLFQSPPRPPPVQRQTSSSQMAYINAQDYRQHGQGLDPRHLIAPQVQLHPDSFYQNRADLPFVRRTRTYSLSHDHSAGANNSQDVSGCGIQLYPGNASNDNARFGVQFNEPLRPSSVSSDDTTDEEVPEVEILGHHVNPYKSWECRRRRRLSRQMSTSMAGLASQRERSPTSFMGQPLPQQNHGSNGSTEMTTLVNILPLSIATLLWDNSSLHTRLEDMRHSVYGLNEDGYNQLATAQLGAWKDLFTQIGTPISLTLDTANAALSPEALLYKYKTPHVVKCVRDLGNFVTPVCQQLFNPDRTPASTSTSGVPLSNRSEMIPGSSSQINMNNQGLPTSATIVPPPVAEAPTPKTKKSAKGRRNSQSANKTPAAPTREEVTAQQEAVAKSSNGYTGVEERPAIVDFHPRLKVRRPLTRAEPRTEAAIINNLLSSDSTDPLLVNSQLQALFWPRRSRRLSRKAPEIIPPSYSTSTSERFATTIASTSQPPIVNIEDSIGSGSNARSRPPTPVKADKAPVLKSAMKQTTSVPLPLNVEPSNIFNHTPRDIFAIPCSNWKARPRRKSAKPLVFETESEMESGTEYESDFDRRSDISDIHSEWGNNKSMQEMKRRADADAVRQPLRISTRQLNRPQRRPTA